MNYQPNPLLYGANEDFYSSFKLAITLCDPIDHVVLSRAVAAAMPRYPYFCITPEKEGECLVLASNPRPVPVFPDDRRATLGGEECNGHLLFFGCEGDRIFLNASHYIADGMGIDPVLKTVLYLYVGEKYGASDLQTERICMPDGAVAEAEYAYPFPPAPFETDRAWPQRKQHGTVYGLRPDAFDGEGMYA